MPKILVADDNTNIQKMVSLAFEERGIDVVSVGNGEAAVRRIPTMNPDLVLADIFMPVRNGYEVCEFVKKDERFSHVPVILLVGAFDPLDEKEARRVGADGVLKKPFVPPDPLIAMVISALEKNPKVAAEMAKAREAVPESIADPLPVLETPARVEVKPLPEYPEPTPEEAALVYGFGSGKRGKEGAPTDDRGPVSPDGPGVDDQEDSSATTHDWRRNAMDFDVPEETSKNTAFALDDATAMFPSEKDVPPRHVKAAKFEASFDDVKVKSAEPAAPLATAAPTSSLEKVFPSTLAPSAAIVPAVSGDSKEVSAAKSSRDNNGFMTATMLGTPAVESKADGRPPMPAVSNSQTTPGAVETKSEEPKSSVGPSMSDSFADQVALEVEHISEPTSVARATHWMDAMTAALKQPDSEENPADSVPAVKMDLDAGKPEPALAVEKAVPVEEFRPAEAAVEAVKLQEAKIQEVKAEESKAELPGAVELAPVQAPEPEEDESFFADDANTPELLPLEPVQSKPRLLEPELESAGPVPVGKLAADPELIAEPEDSRPISKDPALVEPPAVRVTPEPLLEDEGPVAGASGYDEHDAETEPAFAFADEPEPAAAASAKAEHAPEPVAQEAVVDERIATGPIPSREILATIPFLSPPPEVLAAAAKENKVESADDKDMDAMVRKVLEKLEPRLHDLLSQGVLKPLVENILQDEAAKKER